MDFPAVYPLPLFISTWSLDYSGQAFWTEQSRTASSITWPVANTAFYLPFTLPFAYPVRRVFWVNGSSVTSTNMDFGIYTADGTRLYSTGSTAQAGISAVQYVTPTEFLLSPGRYYFALACSSTTANRGGTGNIPASATRQRLIGNLQEASALPLPVTMTGVAVANSCLPLCGITRTASGF